METERLVADLPTNFILAYFGVGQASKTDFPWEGTWRVWGTRAVWFKLEQMSWIRELREIRLGLKCGCQAGRFEHELTVVTSYHVWRNFLIETVKNFIVLLLLWGDGGPGSKWHRLCSIMRKYRINLCWCSKPTELPWDSIVLLCSE